MPKKAGHHKDYAVHLISEEGKKRWSGLTAPKAVMKYQRNIRRHPQAHHIITQGDALPGMPAKTIAECFGGKDQR